MRAYKWRPFDLSRCYQSIHHLLHDKMRNEWMHEKCRPSHASLCRFKLFSFQISLNAFFVLIFFSAVAISFHTKNILFFRITFAKDRRAGDSIRDAGGKMYSLELIRAPGTPHHRSDELMHEGDGRRCIAMLSLVMVGWMTRILPVILHTQLLHRPPSIRHNAIQ